MYRSPRRLPAALSLALAIAAPAFATEGDLDPTFGPNGDGRNTIAFDQGLEGYETDEARDLVVAPDGTIVMAGTVNVDDGHSSIGIARLSKAGLVTGKSIMTRDTYGLFANAIARQPDGKLVVAGAFIDYENASAGQQWLVCRFHAAGSLDASFGDGIVTPGCASDVFQNDSLRGQVRDIVIQPSGRIVLAGDALDIFGVRRAAMTRLDAAGVADGLFGASGIVAPALGQDVVSSFDALAQFVDGQLAAVGARSAVNGRDFLVARYTTDGAPVVQFSGDGVTSVGFNLGPDSAKDDAAAAVAVFADGRIAVAGSAQFEASGTAAGAVAMLLPNGDLDVSFDADGRRTLPVPDVDQRLSAILYKPGADGFIVAGTQGPTATPSQRSASALKLRFDGLPDQTFSNGNVNASFRFADQPADAPSGAVALAAQDDKILVAGNIRIAGTPANLDYGIARLGHDLLFRDGFE